MIKRKNTKKNRKHKVKKTQKGGAAAFVAAHPITAVQQAVAAYNFGTATQSLGTQQQGVVQALRAVMQPSVSTKSLSGTPPNITKLATAIQAAVPKAKASTAKLASATTQLTQGIPFKIGMRKLPTAYVAKPFKF